MKIQKAMPLQRKERLKYCLEATGGVGVEVEERIRVDSVFRGDRLVTADTSDPAGHGTMFTVSVGGVKFPGPGQIWSATWAYPSESIYDVVKAIKLARAEGRFHLADKIERDFLEGEDIARLDLLLEPERQFLLPTCRPPQEIVFRIRFLKSCTWTATVGGWGIR